METMTDSLFALTTKPACHTWTHSDSHGALSCLPSVLPFHVAPNSSWENFEKSLILKSTVPKFPVPEGAPGA